jgi:predicted nucleotide-binding protein
MLSTEKFLQLRSDTRCVDAVSYTAEQRLQLILAKENAFTYSKELFYTYGGEDYTERIRHIPIPDSPCSYSKLVETSKGELIILIDLMLQNFESLILNPPPHSPLARSNPKKVFIVHGHNEALKLNVSTWLYSVGLTPVILHLQPNGGLTSILEKIEHNSDVGCAIILLTADDVGKSISETDYHKRARQNVVFEAGYFAGKLGKNRVVLLYEAGVELPGDLLGNVYILADEHDGWKEQVRLELCAMGFHLT